ncbi:hypothetical protein Csa_010299 [Cucumis sativus]|nr:hypothetical protein Csa_010299 [Cucumis sativus]
MPLRAKMIAICEDLHFEGWWTVQSFFYCQMLIKTTNPYLDPSTPHIGSFHTSLIEKETSQPKHDKVHYNIMNLKGNDF